MENCSIGELADQVNAWCKENRVEPLHNRVGTAVTVRNIRYYQTLGLVDRPSGRHGLGFTEKHRLQLIAIRLLQAKGLPLEKIQSLLYGRSLEDLREVERRGLAELELQPVQVPAQDGWKVIPLGNHYMLLSRTGRDLGAGQKQRILEILNGAGEWTEETPKPGYGVTGFRDSEQDEGGFRPEID